MEPQAPIAGAPMAAIDGATAASLLQALAAHRATSSGSLLTLADHLERHAPQCAAGQRAMIEHVIEATRAMARVWPDGMGGISPLRAGVIDEIAAERRRQIEAEGWSAEHDDRHDRGEMALAAAAYAGEAGTMGSALIGRVKDLCWPWAAHWWKPRGPRRDLIRAGALIVAEIERLDRAEARRS